MTRVNNLLWTLDRHDCPVTTSFLMHHDNKISHHKKPHLIKILIRLPFYMCIPFARDHVRAFQFFEMITHFNESRLVERLDSSYRVASQHPRLKSVYHFPIHTTNKSAKSEERNGNSKHFTLQPLSRAFTIRCVVDNLSTVFYNMCFSNLLETSPGVLSNKTFRRH